MKTTERRFDIDWLRVIAIGFLIIYHVGFVFLPWGVFIGFIQNGESINSLWNPMSMLNIWRIPLLFFVSGMGVCFAIQKRSWKQLILERTRRILVPFLFGILCIVPLHLLVWQKYYQQDLTYSLQPSHLWFLANIFIYVLVLSPLFFILKKNEQGKVSTWLKKLFGTPLGLLSMTAIFVVEAIMVKPETYETYAMSLHGFLLGMLAFLFGFIIVYVGEAFWQTVKKWRWLLLLLAAALFTFRLIEFELLAPNYLKAIESNLWIFAFLGFGYKYLNHPSKALGYLSQAVYPVYILHMIFLYVGSYLIVPLEISALVKLFLVMAFTFIGSFACYELIVRRIPFLRPVFGLKSI
ncbi:MAG: acyltransferase [Bacteroidia bacterium]|nr:MAG: acyltransferase [Bacteroidia bacterium]